MEIFMMANKLHVRFVDRNCPVEVVQHLRSGNACVYGTRRRPLLAQRALLEWVQKYLVTLANLSSPTYEPSTSGANSEFIQTNKRLYKRHWN